MDYSNTERHQAIQAAVAAELARQGITGVDAQALTHAIEQALAGGAPASEGKRPDDLNATNDD